MKTRLTTECSLLIGGLALIAVYLGIRVDGIVQSRQRLQTFEANRQSKHGFVDNPDFTLWSPKRIEEYRQAVLADSHPAIAVLRIPKIGLKVPVLEGTDELALNRGVGHIVGTARSVRSGNIGIAGHRDGFFRGLKDIGRGDVLELETPDEDASYVVDDIEVVLPSDTTVLQPRDKPALTLVTCYPFYFVGSAPNRFIVHASLVKEIPATAARVASNRAAVSEDINQERNQ